jgi:hypothetical protein
MTTTTTAAPAPVLADPAALSPIQWAARLAAYLSRGRGNDDPDVQACRAALSYWRCRRVIDAERDRLDGRDIPALRDLLAHPHRAPGR